MPPLLRYNPLTKEVAHYVPPTEPYSLMYWCRKAILKSIGLANLQQVENLPLPYKLKLYVGTISLSDFFIDGNKLPTDSHWTHVYPAVCLIDNKLVNLRVLPPGREANPADVRFITAFDENNQTIVVEQPTKTLADVIDQSKREGTIFDEEFLWLLMDEMVSYLLENDIYPTSEFGTYSIHFLPNRQIFIEVVENRPADMNQVSTNTVVYAAPEVLDMTNPTSTALTWSIGCIIHECLALEPAFYDPDGSNPFSVMMKIMENQLPPEPQHGSDTLKAVVKMCLTNDPAERITLKTLKHIVQDHFTSS